MSFKAQMALDLDHMMDVDVFADTYVVDGSSVRGIFQEISFMELGPVFSGGLGLAAKFTAITDELAGEYVPDSTIVIDGVTWTVADSIEQAGMMILMLFRNRS